MYTYDEKKSQYKSINTEKAKEKGVDPEDGLFDSKPDESPEDSHETPAKLDGFMSGHYVIGGIEYIYSEGNQAMTQRLSLLRREWPVRANNL